MAIGIKARAFHTVPCGLERSRVIVKPHRALNMCGTVIEGVSGPRGFVEHDFTDILGLEQREVACELCRREHAGRGIHEHGVTGRQDVERVALQEREVCHAMLALSGAHREVDADEAHVGMLGCQMRDHILVAAADLRHCTGEVLQQRQTQSALLILYPLPALVVALVTVAAQGIIRVLGNGAIG
jgi:hypothetical protein